MATQNMTKLTDGKKKAKKGLSATQSLKNEFKSLISALPKDWREQIKKWDEFYRTDKGNARLDNLRGGYAAPTLEELTFIKGIVQA